MYKSAINLEQIHKSIYKYMKSKAMMYESGKSESFLKYQEDQILFSKRKFSPSNINELKEKIDQSQIVYLGDFHTFDQSPKNLERITKLLLKGRRKFSLAVELVHDKHQLYIDSFLEGHITELEFLDSIDYHESWRFPWDYYRPFFLLAKKFNLKVLGLNSNGNLIERDNKAAEIIQGYFNKNSRGRLLVLFGEYHIVPDKLPKVVNKLLSKKVSHLIIHQNLDEVYWKLGIYNIQINNQIIKFNEKEFSLQTSPPWIKYESMIYWYENLCEDPDFDIHDYIMNTGLFTLNENVTETFVFLCEKIISILNLNIDKGELEDFNLYDHSNIKIVLERIERISKVGLSNFYKSLMEQGKSFRIPFGNNYYCSSYSINRIGLLSGQFILDINLKEISLKYENCLLNGTSLEKFLFLVRQHTFSYLCSKIINPYRKCDFYIDYMESLDKKTSKQDKELTKMTLKFLEWDNQFSLKNELNKKTLKFIYSLSRNIGYYIGDKYYDQYFKDNKKGSNKILQTTLAIEFNVDEYHYLLRKTIPLTKVKLDKKRIF